MCTTYVHKPLHDYRITYMSVLHLHDYSQYNTQHCINGGEADNSLDVSMYAYMHLAFKGLTYIHMRVSIYIQQSMILSTAVPARVSHLVWESYKTSYT